MIRIIKWIFVAWFLVGIALGIMVANSIDDHAIVSQTAELSANELDRVKQFIKKNNPSNLSSGQITQTVMSQRDINLALSYFSQKAPGHLNRRIMAKVLFDRQLAYWQFSIKLPNNPLGNYLNVTLEMVAKNTQENYDLDITSVRVGQLTMPSFVTNNLEKYLDKTLKENVPEYNLVGNALQNIKFKKKRVVLNYIFDKKAASAIKSQLTSRVIKDEFKQALMAYSERLFLISPHLSSKEKLNRLVNPMFEYAQQRSRKHNPIIENKAALTVIGAYMLGKDLRKILGEGYYESPKFKNLYINDRYDLSQHLFVSAAITSMANSRLAASIGLKKEVDDSQGGSGFSFADLAADHAGIELAKYATSSKKNAIKLQEKLALSQQEADYMPDIVHLPEGMQQFEFKNNYINTKSAAYTEMKNVIQFRISRLSVYR